MNTTSAIPTAPAAPHPSLPSSSGHRARVARTAGIAILAAVAGCLVTGAVLAFRHGLPADPDWWFIAAFGWATLWIPAGCRLAVPGLLLLACARAAAPAREGRRGRAWRIGVALAAFSAVRLVLQCFAMASFADSGCENAAAFGGPPAALLHWWFTGLAYPLSETTLVVAGFCLPGLPAEDPATPAEDGAGRAERRLLLASAACLALLLVLDVLRFVHLKPVRVEAWPVLLALGHAAGPIAACLALGALARRASGRERWRLPAATPVALFLACGACCIAGDAVMIQWNGAVIITEQLIDLFYLAWPVWLCFLVRSRPRRPPQADVPPPLSSDLSAAVKTTVKILLLIVLVCVIGCGLFLAKEFSIYRKADSLYERLVRENPKTKAGVDEILSSCRQVPIPMSESLWGSDRVLEPNESCVQYRVCGLASWPIDVVYADGTNVVHIYQSYE